MHRGLIVPSKEKRKDKRSKLIKKLGRSRSESVRQSQSATGLVGLLETMRVQLEVSLSFSILGVLQTLPPSSCNRC